MHTCDSFNLLYDTNLAAGKKICFNGEKEKSWRRGMTRVKNERLESAHSAISMNPIFVVMDACGRKMWLFLDASVI